MINRISPVAIAVIAALVALAAPAAARANEVTSWNRIAAGTLTSPLFPLTAGGAAPASQVNMAMVQGAVYDAANAIEPRHRPYLLGTLFDPMASKDAAVATAAYLVLSNIVSTVRQSIDFPARSDFLQALQAAYDHSLAAIPESLFKTEGIAAGTAAADAMIAARQNDGRFGPSPWVPSYEPGHWQPLLNPTEHRCSTRPRGSAACGRS
jgi:hypothetical protein